MSQHLFDFAWFPEAQHCLGIVQVQRPHPVSAALNCKIFHMRHGLPYLTPW